MRLIKISFYLLLMILGVSFAALNANTVDINLYIKKINVPISVLLAITLGLGLFFGVFLCLLRYWRLKMELLKVKNQLKLTEKEIKNLRDIPLKDTH